MTTQIEFREFQASLPKYLHQVEGGDTLVICKDDKPIAELRPIKKRRPMGLAKGEITILPSFYDPLPEEIIEGFEGKAE